MLKYPGLYTLTVFELQEYIIIVVINTLKIFVDNLTG